MPVVLWRGPPRDASIFVACPPSGSILLDRPVSTYVLLTSYVKFEHPCGLYCKVCHRQGRPAFNKKPGIVEPSARQLKAQILDCLQSWSNRDTFRTFDFASPANRSSVCSCAHRATRADLETGFISEAQRQCLSFLPAGTMAHMCPRCPLYVVTQGRPAHPSCRAPSVISVGQLCRR